MKLLLACSSAIVLYSVYRLWRHDQYMKEAGVEPIAAALRVNMSKGRKPKYVADEFSGWESEVERIYRDSQA